MKVFWSDREGRLPPAGCTFYLRPFFSNKTTSFNGSLTTLPSPARAKVLKWTFLPDRETWIKNGKKALDLISKNTLQKVVLARACILELDSSPDPFALTAALKQKSEGAFVFCFQQDSGAFFGASPERLFKRQGNQLFSEAVAGTRKRGKTEEEDLLLEQELLSSEKDRSEFVPVREHLQKALLPFCSLQFSAASVHKTHNVQHIYSHGVGILEKTINDETLLDQIHPTPALCGVPRENAFSLIRELEPFDRGLYGGALGWVTEDASEWIVGIRSCLLNGNVATLYSGAGFVKGSDPEKEWEELDQKLKLYDGILDH